MQRSVHVHVTCSKRPMLSRRTVGAFVGSYGLKSAVTWSRFGSTHFVSATTASFAVIESPKRWTVGVIVAYAFSGRPSQTEVPLLKIGRLAAAGAARTSA